MVVLLTNHTKNEQAVMRRRNNRIRDYCDAAYIYIITS